MHPSSLLPLPTGLLAVTGDEGAGKTRLLRQLCGDLASGAEPLAQADAFWLDLALPGCDEDIPQQLWATWQQRWPSWNEGLQQDLVHELALEPHVGKPLYMLSAGSRRKVALVGLLSSGARVTALDQPYVALDWASIRVLQAFLSDMADHPSRTWVVVDYEADAELPWARVIHLGRD